VAAWENWLVSAAAAKYLSCLRVKSRALGIYFFYT